MSVDASTPATSTAAPTPASGAVPGAASGAASGADARAAQRAGALRLRELVARPPLVLPNAWDAGSAAVIAAAGAPVIATTSGGVSWSLGRGDGQQLDRAAAVAAARRVVAAVDVPVTVDAEGGYGPAPSDVEETVRELVGAGAVGINLEDSVAVGGPLFPVAEQAARLRAARAAAERAGLPELVLNARTDVVLFGLGDLDEVLLRARAYAAAGADGLFVPGLLDLDALTELCGRSPLPINAMAVPGGPGIAELAATGVQRISVGTALAQVAYTAARRAAEELLGTGNGELPQGVLGFGDVDALVRR